MAKRLLYIFLIAAFMAALSLLQHNDAVTAYKEVPADGVFLSINEIMPDNRSTIADEDGSFEDWIEILNSGNQAVNLKGYGLTDKNEQPMLWTFPDVTIEPGEYLVVWASGKDRKTGSYLHTNFRIGAGEAITLSNPQGAAISSIMAYGEYPDISFGSPGGGGSPIYLANATPGGLNSSAERDMTPYMAYVRPPEFSHESGFYEDGFDLELTCSEAGVVIRYTLDGSEPGPESPEYKDLLHIDSRAGEPNKYSAIRGTSLYDYPPRKEVFKATVVRARSFSADGTASKTVTHTFFVDENMAKRYKLPVISLAIDPPSLFDYEYGIYVKGKVFDDYIRDNPGAVIQGDTPANYNQRGRQWEREASLEFFEPDGTLGFSQNVGLRTFGAWSRANRHKPLRIIARDEYSGKDSVNYALFPGLTKRGSPSKPLRVFKEFLLRNSGNDWEYTLIRDALMQSLVTGLGLDTQAYRPAVVFINGEFWGIHNIRETFDEYYIQNNYSIDPKDSVILECQSYGPGMTVFHGRDGDEQSFNSMLDFVRSNDMSLPENYEIIKAQIDTDNFIIYSIAQIYFANTDWPGNNVKVWRKRTEEYDPNAPPGHDGRWRWMLYDTDFGFGLYGRPYNFNALEFATTPHGEPWPNPEWATVLLRSLLTNEEFRNDFLTRASDLMNSRFSPVYAVDRITEMKKAIEPAIQEHLDRWMINGQDINLWKSEISAMVVFAQNRASFVRRDIRKYFDIKESAIVLEVNDPSGGTIRVNSFEPDLGKGIWKGTLFNGIPSVITAIPAEGFIFAGWEGAGGNAGDASLKLIPDGDIKLKATFVRK